MILQTKDFKAACTKILSAIDTSDTSKLMEMVELCAEGNNLTLSVTNNEYYVSTIFNLEVAENMKATINANLFLKLISQITTETLEIISKDTYIQINANGKYKVPIIFSNYKMMKLPKISILNPTVNMQLDTEILKSILNYNSKELQKGIISNEEIQKLHYIDDQGAITFTTGACVNNFTLPKPIQILLNNKIVKLFKLLDSETVDFTLGYDFLSEDIIQTKIKIESPNVAITAILNCDNSLLKMVPTTKIRSRANAVYPYTININKNSLAQAIARLLVMIMPNKSKSSNPTKFQPTAKFVFSKDKLTIWDLSEENCEEIAITNYSGEEEYTAFLNLNDIKLTLDTCIEPYLALSFGDKEAIVISRLNIFNVIPECNLVG